MFAKLAALLAAICGAITVTAATATAVTQPSNHLLWRNHAIGHGGKWHTTRPITLNAPTDYANWMFAYRWKCSNPQRAVAQAYYTTSAHPGARYDLTATATPASHYWQHVYRTLPSGSTVRVHWRMNVAGQEACGHTFRVIATY